MPRSALLALLTIRERRFDFETHTTLLTFADVALLTILIHASGGLPSGLGMLLLIAIAGGSLMLGRRITVFYASLAAIAVMLEHSWDYLTGSVASLLDLSQGYPQVGMLGVGFIATAFLGNMLAERLRATEALAERRGVDLANLTQVNALIIQHMQIGVLVCDAGGNIRLSNQAAQKFLNLGPPSSTKPQDVDRGIPRSRHSAVPLAGRRREGPPATPGAVAGERAFAAAAPLPRAMATRYYRASRHSGDDKAAGALIFLEDMAVLKQQAQQMKMESLARLTASIAHEIRNPLGALSNAAQLLGETPQQNGEGRRLIKIIDDQSRRMNVIVENVTQLSRRDHVSPMRFALDPWLREFARQYADTTRVPREIFSFTATEGIEICMDPEQLHQVVANLCQNALRHSPPYTGTPLIRLDSGLDTEQRPTLDVIDWGTGVASDIVDFIFDPFFTTTPKGTGLGLYIARELCEGNGATLDYHPGEGKIGCRFHVTFTRPENCVETGTA